jgi:folate-binding Fe-S cluster repair protein YgfZ
VEQPASVPPQDGFAWIERRSLRDAQLTELKKYAVFSKVTIAARR